MFVILIRQLSQPAIFVESLWQTLKYNIAMIKPMHTNKTFLLLVQKERQVIERSIYVKIEQTKLVISMKIWKSTALKKKTYINI